MSIYLDNAATTKPCEPAVSAAFYCMVENFGNPSSLHKMGVDAEQVLTDARKAIASAVVCKPESVYFTSGATESNNTAVLGAAAIYGKRRKKIVTTSIEHPSVEEPFKYLEEHGFEIVRITPDRNGGIDHEELVAAVDDHTCLVSCMLVNNETGYILPVKRAFMRIKRDYPECITHCDAVQGFLKIPLKATELYADMISLSAHKVHGIKGIGALILKKGIRVAPIVRGGGQEKSLRSGTESVPLIAGFGAAVSALHPFVAASFDSVTELNRFLREKLSELEGAVIHSKEDFCSPYILNVSMAGIRSEILLHYLESREIYVSSGSACSKGAKSSVLREFGIHDREADCAIRISLSRETSRGDMEALAEALRQGYTHLIKVK